ncbi:hypothetical protein ACINB_39930 [Acidovorax sp. NB1]|nr:hypothetical protein ACINB_39930 [Acidovorax sp. NB1]
MQPKPRLSRLEIDKDLREAAAGMEVLVSRWAAGGNQVGANKTGVAGPKQYRCPQGPGRAGRTFDAV